MSRLTAAAVLAIAFLASAAAAQTTRGSFDRPPFYHGRLRADAAPVAHVAPSFRASDPSELDATPDRSPALAALLDSLRAEIDRLGVTRPLAGGDWPMRDGPAVRFGVARGGTRADGTPLAPGDIDPHAPRRMSFEVTGPGRAWKDKVAKGAADSVHSVVVVQLGFADAWVRQKDWKGHKSIELGTGRSMPVEWLTSLDDPVQVLQLTGAVVTPAGKVLRVGAENLLARRTGMAASVLGGQEVLTEDDLAAVFADGPGGAPVWRAALRDLVTGLTTNAR